MKCELFFLHVNVEIECIVNVAVEDLNLRSAHGANHGIRFILAEDRTSRPGPMVCQGKEQGKQPPMVVMKMLSSFET